MKGNAVRRGATVHAAGADPSNSSLQKPNYCKLTFLHLVNDNVIAMSGGSAGGGARLRFCCPWLLFTIWANFRDYREHVRCPHNIPRGVPGGGVGHLKLFFGD